MATDVIPGWRKTGKSASSDHFVDVDVGLFEATAYGDDDRPQGAMVVALETKPSVPGIDPNVWMGKVLAIEDEFYLWWFEETFGRMAALPDVPFHFCACPQHRCEAKVMLQNVLHIDVFRPLPGKCYTKVRWLPIPAKRLIESFSGSEVLPAGDGLQNADGQVFGKGQEGLDGLAAALGQGSRKEDSAAAVLGLARVDKKRGREDGNGATDDEDEGVKHPDALEGRRNGASSKTDLGQVLSSRSPRAPADDLQLRVKGKKRKKERKRRREENEESSSSEEDFQLASLPEGVDRLLKVHEERPGVLANLTLKRYHDMISRATGGEAAQLHCLPPVGRAYLHQIFFHHHHPSQIGMRCTREMKTIMLAVDLVCRNDSLRALGVLLQRQKSLELELETGRWREAQALELVPSDDVSSFTRQEKKVAQDEAKANYKLYKGAGKQVWAHPWAIWRIPQAGGGAGAGIGDDDPDGKAPLNDDGDRSGVAKGKWNGRRRWNAKGKGRDKNGKKG